ncbi:uncharacterized protein LOC119633906 isoform X2 [Glossina fuscipes]|uniref:Dipeptidase n=1 Tax=Glossina fuscipes TaxID=7396 RepID=A0A8U0WDZ1_9MUSC|nr:uncharacterized protein LOC119633906 isoform X2 [Glossina fuscipes]
MTDLKRSLDVGRVHQTTTKQNCHDAYRSSCSSTPELKSKHNCKNNSQTNEIADYRNPLLLTLQDHPHMSSNSGGSTSSTAIAATIIGCPGYMNGVAGAEIQFDEHDIYYVSPSKRKSSLSACQTPIMRGYERLRSFSPTSATATIVPSYPPIMPSAAYGARISGASGQNFSFESNDISAHYSDTAMQVLRSGSCSAMGSMLNSASANNSSTSSLAQQHLAPSQRGQNNVTFSNHISEQRASAVTTPQNRGSLRRNKGRSNQSLCSCDAGAETELNPDFTRPLYQYSLERRHKTHTYTCEQNAQILMRIERERKRKFSLSGNTGSDIIVGADAKDDTENDVSYLSDVETIPPVPPPPALKRNGSIRSLRLLQQHFQQHMSTSSSNNTTITTTQRSSNAPYNGIKVNKSNNSQHTGNNNSNGSIVTLCSGDLLNDCSKSVHDMRAVIDDCTTSILKCANAAVGSDIASTASTTTNGSYKPQVATLATITAQGKPDVCHVTTATAFGNCPPPYRFVDDDIVIPKSQKVDPALCFLHKTPTGTVGTGPPLGFVDLQQRTSQRDLQSMHKNKHSSSLSLSKYNTIGPSSDYARQLAIYNQQMLGQHDQSQQLPLLPPSSIGNDKEPCRCFSQSWSNFSHDSTLQQKSCSKLHINYDNQHHHHAQQHQQQQQQQQQQQDHHIFHTSTKRTATTGRDEKIVRPSNSRSFTNLLDFDNCYDGHHAATHHKHHLSFGRSNSGLKDKLLHGQISSSKMQQRYHKEFHCDKQENIYLRSPGSPTSLHVHHNEKHRRQNSPHHHSSLSSIMPWKHRPSPSRGSSSSGTNSFRFDVAKHWLAVSSILLIIGAASVAVPLALRVAASAPFEERLRVALQLLDQVPLIDGHNDLPWNIRKFLHNKLNDFNFNEDLRNVMPWARSHWSHTDLTRLKKGRVSAQFWAAYVPCEAQHRDAVQLTLEQIDVIKRLTDRYAPQLTTCTSAQDIIEAHKNQQLCSLTGVEGGHSLGGSLAVLRTLYAIGVRYMTLTSTCHTPWADSSYADAPTFNVKHGGLTIFGKTIIREMNRLGMMVDLSHVSTGTMRDALEVSEAPVIFSHSSAYELCNSSRNVQDDMLQSLARNGGLIMVNFYSRFLSCSENSTVHDAVAHINHIKRVAGIDHVGLGAGYDGINLTSQLNSSDITLLIVGIFLSFFIFRLCFH